MNNKYFTPIEFEDTETKEKPKKVDPTFNKERLKVALKEVKEEVKRLEMGTSKYLRRAINFGPYGCPAQNSLKTLEKDPNWKNFETFMAVAKQDFSTRPAEAMKEMILKAVEK